MLRANYLNKSVYLILIMFILYVSKAEHIEWRFSNYSNSVIQKNGTNLSLKRVKHEKNKSNFTNNTNAANILVIGDSHVLDVLNSLKGYKFKDGNNVEVRYHFLDDECLSVFFQDNEINRLLKIDRPKKHEQCEFDSNNFKNSVLFKDSQVVVYSSEWKHENLKYIERFFQYIKTKNKKGLLLGPNALFKIKPNDMLIRSSSQKEVNSIAFKYLNKDIFKLDEIMQDIAKKNNIIFFSKIRAVCFNKQCEVVFKDGSLSFLDHTHWTYTGATRFGKKIFGLNLEDIINQ